MVTFYANPDDKNEPWIEREGIKGYGFRIWHYMFFAFSALTILVVLICCCIKIRIPRTKQEIDADYKRKKLTEKFRRRLKLIANQDMNELDLQKALEIIQEDYRNESTNNCQSNVSPGELSITIETQVEPQQLSRKRKLKTMKFIKPEDEPSTSALP